MSSVVLVEGKSDRAALHSLLGDDRDRASIVAMGGVTNVRKHLEGLDLDARVAVLCDAGEVSIVERAVDEHPGPVAIFVCDTDLEEELLRAAGVERLLDFIDRMGEGRKFATLRKQPAHRGQTIERSLHRFFGTFSGRNTRYAAALTAELGIDEAPAPLAEVVAWIQEAHP